MAVDGAVDEDRVNEAAVLVDAAVAVSVVEGVVVVSLTTVALLFAALVPLAVAVVVLVSNVEVSSAKAIGTHLKNTSARDMSQFPQDQGATTIVCFTHSEKERTPVLRKLAISQEGCGDFPAPLRCGFVGVAEATPCLLRRSCCFGCEGRASSRLADTEKSLRTRAGGIFEMGSTNRQKSESEKLYFEKNEVVDDKFVPGEVDDAGNDFGAGASGKGCAVEEAVMVEVDDAVSEEVVCVELEAEGATFPPDTFQMNVMPTRLISPTGFPPVVRDPEGSSDPEREADPPSAEKSGEMNPPQKICEEEALKEAEFPSVKLLVDAPSVSGVPWAFAVFCHVPRQLEG